MEKELEDLLNKHSLDAAANTPDFILAQYLMSCYQAYKTATDSNIKWHNGWKASPEN